MHFVLPNSLNPTSPVVEQIKIHNYSANQSGAQLWLWGSQMLSRESCQQSKAKSWVSLNLLNLKRGKKDTFVLLGTVKQRKIF